MTKRMRIWTQVAASLAAMLLALAPSARADAEGNVTVGTQWWDQTAPEAKYQEFGQVPKGMYVSNFNLRDYSGRRFITFYGGNVSLNNQYYGLTIADGIKWKFDVNYLEIPHLFSLVAKSPYITAAPGVYVLPDVLQGINQKGNYVPNMQSYLANAPTVGLGIQTDISSVKFKARPSQGLQFEVRGSDRVRTGAKAYGGTFGFSNAVEIREPIDQRMLDGDAILNYSKDKMKVMASVGISEFLNRVGQVTWDNPQRLTDSTTVSGRGRMDLYPDNKVLRGNVALGWQLPSQTTLAATVNVSRGTQNDPWIPATVNSALLAKYPILNNPGGSDTSTDAVALRTTADLRVTSALTDALMATLRVRASKYDNQTPVHTIKGIVSYDASADTSTSIDTDPWGNSQAVGALDLDYRVSRQLKLSATAEHQIRKHYFREIAENTENIFGMRARFEPMDEVQFEAGYRHGNRKFDETTFDSEPYRNDAGAFTEQPFLRRYDVAARVQDVSDAALSWTATSDLAISANVSLNKSDFPGSDSTYGSQTYGVQRLSQLGYSAQVMYMPREDLDLSVGYGMGLDKASQRSNQNSGAALTQLLANDWYAGIEDHSSDAFAHLTWQAKPKKLTFAADYVFDRTRTAYNFVGAKGVDLPDTFYREHNLTLEARYQIMASTQLIGRYGYQEWTVIDFENQNVPLLGLAGALGTGLYLGDGFQSYHVNRVALLASRSF